MAPAPLLQPTAAPSDGFSGAQQRRPAAEHAAGVAHASGIPNKRSDYRAWKLHARGLAALEAQDEELAAAHARRAARERRLADAAAMAERYACMARRSRKPSARVVGL